MASEFEQQLALIRNLILSLQAELAQGLDDADKDPGGFKMATLEARLKALEDFNEELPDPDDGEWPDQENPYFGSDDATLGFTGVVYIEGLRVTGLNAQHEYPWIRIRLSGDPALFEQQVTEQPGPPPSPFPQNEEWYEKASTSGDIHVPRF